MSDDVVKVGHNYVWEYKYRMKQVKHILLPPKLKRMFNKFIEEKHIPHLFLYSSKPGTGKTSLARALLDECGYEYKFINASKDNGIDIVRTQITRFVSSFGFENKPKAVILDEFDGASISFQRAMRALMDEHTDVRFIFICNFSNNIIDAIWSRTQSFNFNFSDAKDVAYLTPKIQEHIKRLLKAEKVLYKDETIDTFVVSKYPDIRRMINTLHAFSKQNDVITDDIFNYKTVDDEFIDLLLSKRHTTVRQYIVDNGYDYDELYTVLYEKLIPKLEPFARADSIIKIAEYMDMSTRSINKEITFSACVLEIFKIMSGS